METNEITMILDAKLDIHGKRPESLKFKTWTRCLVKVEAIKCLPSFLRITFKRCPQANGEKQSEEQQMLESVEQVNHEDDEEEPPQLSVSINVPGVSVSPTESRTKPHSYGLFWKQNRRDCYIYLAIETEVSLRRHMKWIKKSIKNLELHRQLFLEQRRNSRGPGRGIGVEAEMFDRFAQQVDDSRAQAQSQSREKSSSKSVVNALGPLPQIPDTFDGDAGWSSVRVSEIYEEIFENGIDLQQQQQQQPPRLSRRFSRTSIASGIYEEMKPTTANFKAIVEEVLETAPPLPPLPPPRKRINTFETDPAGLLGEIPRSNTNPESEMAKKKKYKNMLDNLFGGVGRSKRAESVSENVACSVEDLVRSDNAKEAVYANDAAVAAKRQKKPPKLKGNNQQMSQSKRNSFSSPDLSKINFLDTFDEERIASLLLQNSFTNSEDLDLSSESLDDSSIHFLVGGGGGKSSAEKLGVVNLEKLKAESLESINISQQIPINFNFSACNSSTINLVGANGANLLQAVQKNKIMVDDLTGYCVMAPIIQKKLQADNGGSQPLLCSQSTSSGYSTGSYCSTTSASSCTNSTEDNSAELPVEKVELRKPLNEVHDDEPATAIEESTIYENMVGSSLNSSSVNGANADFTGNLYENLLTVKAAQELISVEQPGPPPPPPPKMSTSTPTGGSDVGSPHIEEEENFYQTPRKSIISVDDKIPSYYPNSCDTGKLRRRSHSPTKATPTSTSSAEGKIASTAIGLRHLVNVKMRRERKENYYISSPQKILDQRQGSNSSSNSSKSKASKTKKTAHKISEHVYAVSHLSKKTNNNNNNNNNSTLSAEALQEKLQSELLQLAALQNIDFKFDDSKSTEIIPTHSKEEVENCFQVKDSASRILHKYATLARSATSASTTTSSPSVTTPQRSVTQHHLQQSQQSNTQETSAVANGAATSKLEANVVVAASEMQLNVVGSKKFASLPRFKKIDFSPLKLKINNVLQRNQQQQQEL